MASPLITGLGVSVLVGLALVVAGLARTLGVFRAGSFGQGVFALVGGVLTFLAGAIVMIQPGIGLASVTLLLGGYLLADGVSGAILAFRMRPETGWGWMLLSAGMGVLLGVMLLREWPLSGLWAIGTLVGVNLLFTGFSLVAVGLTARHLATGVAGRVSHAAADRVPATATYDEALVQAVKKGGTAGAAATVGGGAAKVPSVTFTGP